MKKEIKQYKVVLKKELKDAFRDKKSIFASFILPLILFPLIFALMGSSASDITEKTTSPKVAIYTMNGANYNAIEPNEDNELFYYMKNSVLGASSSLKVEINFVKSTNLQQDLIDGNVTVIIAVESNIKELIETNQSTSSIKLIYDDRSTTGASSASVVNTVIQVYDTIIREQRIDAVDSSLNTNPIMASALSLSNAFPDLNRSGTDSSLLQLLIPLLVTLLISVGGANIAVDLIAGEKERNTFESLLSTSANRFSILSAKFSVVIIFSFITAISEVIAIGISILLGTSEAMQFGSVSGLTLPFDGTLLVIFNLLMMCALFSSILLVLTSTANSVKEANAKTLWVTLLPMIIAYSIIYLDATDVSLVSMAFPIYNVVASIKMLLAGVMNYAYLWGSLAFNFIYAIIAIYITLKSFSKESLISK